MPEPMPDKTSMFDRAIPVFASLEIATSLDVFHKLGFETHDLGDHNYGIAIREHPSLPTSLRHQQPLEFL